MTLSELIISYRNKNRLSQRRFAEICGLSNGYISMLEKEENPKTKQPITPTLPLLKKLAKGMNLSVNDLFSMVDDIDISLNNEQAVGSGGNVTDEDIKVALFNGESEVTDAMWDEVKRYAKYVQERENGNI